MLKALSPVMTLAVGWLSCFSNPTTAMLLNILVITFGVLLSSIGEVTFAWDGFMFQIVATIAESTRLTLIQWVLSMPARQTGPDVEKDAQRHQDEDDHGILSDDEEEEDDGSKKERDGNGSVTSSSSSTATAIEESDNHDGNVGRYTDQEKEQEGGDVDDLGLRTHEPLPVEERLDDDGNDDNENKTKGGDDENIGVAGMTPLVLLYYYAPVCAMLNFCVALVAEAPRFDWDVFSRVSWTMLVANGAVAFMLNVSSVFLVSCSSRQYISCSRCVV